MKITALTENTSRDPQIGCEHGLSLYIETNAHKLLFDAGQSALFAANAEQLGVDLSQVGLAVLSHGHYDHAGGLERFLQLNDHAPVYLSRYATEPHYNADGKYIGTAEALSHSDRLRYTGEAYRIDESLALYSCNERPKPYPLDTGGLSMESGGARCPEDFRHEQYLLITENGKRVLISGCSHKGIRNLMHWFRPDVLVGGFHLMKRKLDDRLIADAKALDNYPTAYYTCHCTGVEQYRYMKPYMQRLHYLSAGQTIEL
ncbi:MBL fold metallo-hydrolase [Ruminococcus sp.]|uniref:MBL fold metallo-hydrolase n=1 Tax=Ruminococcus sp. TaxID=41978 RepID=UPI00388DDDBB